jgi:hypothetical protein
MADFARAISSGILAFFLAASAGAQANQVPDPPRAGWFALRGEASMFGEAYGISGRDPRRPGSTGRVVFQPTLEFSRFFKVGVDLQLTSEGNTGGAGSSSPALNAGRQRLNQLGISPTWSWGRVDLGDFTDSYTPLTFSGIRVRGAGATVNPGLLRLAAFHGQAQTAVLGAATNASYARTVSGGRVGVGRAEGSFFEVTLVRARDDAGSLPPPDDTAFVDPRLDDPTVDPDTLAVGTLLNPLAVTPQDNVVASAAGRLLLFDQHLRLHGELSGAGYSRDVRASALDNETLLEEVPGLVRGLFTPRIGSSYGAAYTAGAEVRVRSFSGLASVRRIDPGYVALGVASMLNDQAGWMVSGTQRLGRSTSLRLDVARQSDNLATQKAYTTRRDRYGVALNLRPFRRLTSSLRLQYVGMSNDLTEDDARWIAYDNWLASASQAYSFGHESLLRSVGLSYMYRGSGDANPARAAASMDAHSTTVRAVIAPSRTTSITPSVGVIHSASSATAGQWRARQTYGIAAQTRMRDGRWTSSLSLGSTDDGGTGAFQTRLTSRYTVSTSSDVTLSIRSSHYRNAPNPFGPPGSFHERMASLQLTRRLGNGS